MMRFQILTAKTDRKGITLLFVISMIVLFMLLATTFLVVSSQYFRGAKSYSKSEIFEREPQNDLDQALYIMLRDTRDTQSPLRGVSLLADMYGYNAGFKGEIGIGTVSYRGNTGQHIVQFEIVNAKQFVPHPAAAPLDHNQIVGQLDNVHVGRLFTITSGPAKGMSGRILTSQFEDINRTTFAVFFDRQTNYGLIDDVLGPNFVTNLEGATFIVNGKPFQGKGADFDTAADNNGQNATGDQALLPNRVGETEANFLTNYVGAGELNETYDAADYQNPFLSATVANTSGNFDAQVLPSLHRPRLVATNAANSRSTFRPLAADHPDFPVIDAINGPWDVDNDKDRINDSVWVDFNLPVLTDSNGRTFKRMFAVLVRDLDGKLNLNAHSNFSHLDDAYSQNQTADVISDLDVASPFASSTLHSTVAGFSHHPMGQGWGPPEINMRTVFLNTNDLDALMFGLDLDGDGSNDIYGRNGFDANVVPPLPGSAVGVDSVVNNKFYNVPQTAYFQHSFGSNWDIHGRFVVGHDINGQPRYSRPVAATERLNTEYERRIDSMVSMGSHSIMSTDLPFTYSELERIVRGNDNDATSLPDRITRLAPNTFGLINNANNLSETMRNRLKVTTHSYSIPVPPTDLREYYSQILFNNAPAMQDPSDFAAFHAGRRLPLGINLGSKMNINFPFGNGQDDSAAGTPGFGLVDETWGPVTPYFRDNPADLVAVSESYQEELLNGIRFDHDNDPSPDANGDPDTADRDAYLIRSRFASQIYVMARIIFQQSQAVADATTVPDVNNDGNFDNNDLHQWLAQWAINVVDFRDQDSIMTPFEYDTNPFNGWDVDGNPMTIDGGAERGLVFGCERPDLLLTESFAYHNRRVEDLDSDDNEGETTTDINNPDDDYDQRLKPFGGLMLELWNPYSDRTNGSTDIYRNVNGTFGVDLTKLSFYPGYDDATADNIDEQPSPVWRIVFTRSDVDLDNPPPGFNAGNEYERAVYFVTLDDFGNDITQLQYDLPFTPTPNNTFTLTTDVKNSLHPISYLRTAVLGTGHYEDPGNSTHYITPLGRRSDADPATDLNLAATRGFLLDAGNRQLTIREFDATNGVQDSVRSTEVIPCVNLNISEADDGYAAQTTGAGFLPAAANYVDATFGNLTEFYYIDGSGDVEDDPFDEGRFGNDGTDHSYRYAHLQRLANPLVGWDPNSNPYRTVDTLTVDLQVFNGEETGGSGPPIGGTAGDHFGTRERGEVDTRSGSPQRLLWRKEPNNDLNSQMAQTAGADNHFFSFHIESPNTPAHEETLGEELYNDNFSTIINYSYDYYNNPVYGQPVEFPSLRWNNRPYVSQYELMLVPFTSSSQLLRRFTPSANVDFGENQVDARYEHLINFFQSSAENPGPQTDRAPNLYRLFDYIHVPSKFTNSETYLDPQVFSDVANNYGFRPPYNVIPSFREPGKINLNTIYSQSVFNALKGGNNNQGGYQNDISWPEFIASRRGEDGSNIFGSTPELSYFGNPFRAGSSGGVMYQGSAARNGVDATLLRGDAPNGGGNATNSGFDGGSAFDGEQTHTSGRHPYLRYRNRVRLGNLTTTQSNCYAVWITVGYFEYDEVTGQLGREIGSQTGKVERHRAFYMIDRSIPVGFEPGKNHNVDKTIKLRRYIE
ncbi:MAG: hypothetical protein VX768_09150 [Planctomycetota bacterium]|nr:hypothetical protein [Planctomycetota bacterium]